MDIIAKFHKHADECRRMARFTHDLETRAIWNRMADRWLLLAANEQARNEQLSDIRTRRVRIARSRAA